MSTFPVTVELRFDIPSEDIDTLIDMAGYGIAYWADRAETGDETYTIWWTDGEDDDKLTVTVTYQDLIEALIETTKDNTYAGDYAREYFTEGLDAGVFDSELADTVVQKALFGEVIYG